MKFSPDRDNTAPSGSTGDHDAGAVLVHAYAAAADFAIIQKNRAFSVRQIVIKVGDRVTFVNDDSVNHNVFSETKGSEFDILHPVMRLEVQVRQ